MLKNPSCSIRFLHSTQASKFGSYPERERAESWNFNITLEGLFFESKAERVSTRRLNIFSLGSSSGRSIPTFSNMKLPYIKRSTSCMMVENTWIVSESSMNLIPPGFSRNLTRRCTNGSSLPPNRFLLLFACLASPLIFPLRHQGTKEEYELKKTDSEARIPNSVDKFLTPDF